VRRAAGAATPGGSLAFSHLRRCPRSKRKGPGHAGLRKERTAAGQALAISIAGTEAGPITFDPKFSPAPERDEGCSETGSRITRAPRVGEGDGGEFGPKACVTSACVCLGGHIAKCSNEGCQNIMGRGAGIVRQFAGDTPGLVPCVGRVGVIEVRRSFTAAVLFCRRPSQSAR
jgi:hypothetical protein